MFLHPIENAQKIIEDWRNYYNDVRLHGWIGHKAPISLQNLDAEFSPLMWFKPANSILGRHKKNLGSVCDGFPQNLQEIQGLRSAANNVCCDHEFFLECDARSRQHDRHQLCNRGTVRTNRLLCAAKLFQRILLIYFTLRLIEDLAPPICRPEMG